MKFLLLLVLATFAESTRFRHFHKVKHQLLTGQIKPNTLPPGYSPQQVRKGYGLDAIQADGTGQKIAIVDMFACPQIQASFVTFSQTFGLPTTGLQVINQGVTQTDNDWCIEQALDVEWAHAIAPKATILLIQTPATDSGVFNGVGYANQQGAHIVSMSWGGDEFSGENTYDNFFQSSTRIYVASSGDVGGVPIYPATSPNVIGVGGTTLQLDSSGNRVGAETGWSDSGGGVSTIEILPAYQLAYHLTGKRQSPDVSFLADPNTGVAVYYGSWYQVGGTSLAAPCIAGVFALINQLKGTPLTGLGILTQLYGNLASVQKYGSDFWDVTSGTAGSNQAHTGYDDVTGLGSPKATGFISTLSGVSPSPVPSPTPTPVPSPTPHPSPVPTPTPTPHPSPVPTPTPVPIPTPKHSPSPSPVTTPVPSPKPSTIPTPVPSPPAPTPQCLTQCYMNCLHVN